MSAEDPKDPLAVLVDELVCMPGRPVSEHPGALEDVHRTLVAELEALARVGRDHGDAGPTA